MIFHAKAWRGPFLEALHRLRGLANLGQLETHFKKQCCCLYETGHKDLLYFAFRASGNLAKQQWGQEDLLASQVEVYAGASKKSWRSTYWALLKSRLNSLDPDATSCSNPEQHLVSLWQLWFPKGTFNGQIFEDWVFGDGLPASICPPCP